MYRKNKSASSVGGIGRIGPRAKCDQVVYEAIAKATEIIVRSRCDIPKSKIANGSKYFGGEYGKNDSSGVSSSGSSRSRFNIEVGEVEQVRSILHRWRRSLHVPLRLDVFYQYPAQSNSNGPDKEKRELLERWSINYISNSSSTENNSISASDTLAQLRQVCKKVVILLRTIHSLARMLPSYSLHRRLSHVSSSQVRYNNYHGSDAISTDAAMHKKLLDGGTIGFSIYASGNHEDCGSAQQNSGEDNLKSFTRHDFSPVPTPYGMLHISSAYIPNPLPTLSRSMPIAIAANTNSTNNIPLPLPKEERREEYRNAESQSLRVVSDFIIQDYTDRRFSLPVHKQEQSHEQKEQQQQHTNQVLNQKEKNKKTEFGEEKGMSGLSLALLNECQISDQNKPIGIGPESAQPQPFLRMHSFGDEHRREKIGIKKSSSARNRTSLSGAVSVSPKHYLLNHGSRHMSLRQETPISNATASNATKPGEYGYGYNNNFNVALPDTTKQARIDSNGFIFPSPPQPPGLTPPFSQSPRLLNNPNKGSRSSSPKPVSASPPFQNPSSLASQPPQTKKSKDGLNSPKLPNMLLPPGALEVLQASPFQQILSNENSLMSSMLPLPPSGFNTSSAAGPFPMFDTEPPFVGSFGSASSAGLISRSFHQSVCHDRNDLSSLQKSQMQTPVDYEEMPFADVCCDSVHGGDASTASSFAFRCATASRLQMFDHPGGGGESVFDGAKEDQRQLESLKGYRKEDFASQLAEFRNFGASLHIQKSVVGVTGGSDSSSVRATPVA